jgi:hypothetical protein
MPGWESDFNVHFISISAFKQSRICKISLSALIGSILTIRLRNRAFKEEFSATNQYI